MQRHDGRMTDGDTRGCLTVQISGISIEIVKGTTISEKADSGGGGDVKEEKTKEKNCKNDKICKV